jgi:pilus assembly protein CpaF
MSPDGRRPALPEGLVTEVHDAVAAGRVDGRVDAVAEAVRAGHPLAGAEDVRWAVGQVLHRLGGLGALQPLLDDPDVSEVMVNGPDRPVWIERSGALVATDVVLDARSIELAVERIVGPLGLRADRTQPVVDARLADGSRVNVVVPPLAVDGPCITIRRFTVRAATLADLCPPGVDALLTDAVAERRNVVVSGGTGAGKTTLLNALAGAVGRGERLITVEDAAELALAHPHVVRLETRPGGGVRELVRNALRMRPDRIIVGEVRGPEALDLLLALNTGHEGGLSTLHADGAAEALDRLATMALLAGGGLPLDAVRAHVAASIDAVVHVARRPGGARRVVEVVEPDPVAGRPARRLAGPAGVEARPRRRARGHR